MIGGLHGIRTHCLLRDKQTCNPLTLPDRMAHPTGFEPASYGLEHRCLKSVRPRARDLNSLLTLGEQVAWWDSLNTHKKRESQGVYA